ncbi:MAG: arginine--tRNA ligase [Deltaproteobacteria bacterium]|nr:arginine--tRNA ligase [Deltaproteobacteria bacterium]
MFLEEKLTSVLASAIQKLGASSTPAIQFSTPKQTDHGDVATNVAFMLAKPLKNAPRKIAENLVQSLHPLPDWIVKVEVAGSGFINFFVKPSIYFKGLGEILKRGKKFGTSDFGHGKKIILEFVSANPTGPLNVVSARAAAVGDTLANLFNCVGYKAHKEYYINDVGNQIELFAQSLQARCRQALGEEASIPEEGYQGEYLKDLAKKLFKKKKKYSLEDLKKLGLKEMIQSQKKSLKDFGVEFDRWFSQSELFEKNEIENSLKRLKKTNHLYEKEGALFFKSTDFGDDKDRVVKKQDGEYSYFASDIAYHADKLERKFDIMIDIFGPDHHGYLARTKAAVQALGFDPEALTILIVQQVNLMEGEVLVKMSKRAGKIITMDLLLEEVGKDVARYFFLQRSASTPLDFDLELAKKTTLENPVFYIQYAHARISSIFRKSEELGIKPNLKKMNLTLLDLPEEKELAKLLLEFPDILIKAAEELAPHQIAFYALELSKLFQTYYSAAKNDPRYKAVDPENKPKTEAKLYLLKNVQIVLQNTLNILGISAPDRMEKDASSAL